MFDDIPLPPEQPETDIHCVDCGETYFDVPAPVEECPVCGGRDFEVLE